jgi:hypothetical protein
MIFNESMESTPAIPLRLESSFFFVEKGKFRHLQGIKLHGSRTPQCAAALGWKVQRNGLSFLDAGRGM